MKQRRKLYNCDLAASYLIRKLENEGYRIPEDVSGKGIVEIHGKACPVLGRVCMDQMGI